MATKKKATEPGPPKEAMNAKAPATKATTKAPAKRTTKAKST